jgi:hypothetical protein
MRKATAQRKPASAICEATARKVGIGLAIGATVLGYKNILCPPDETRRNKSICRAPLVAPWAWCYFVRLRKPNTASMGSARVASGAV